MAQVPSNCHPTRFGTVFVLTVAAFLGDQIPSIRLNKLDYVSNLHSSCNCSLLSFC